MEIPSLLSVGHLYMQIYAFGYESIYFCSFDRFILNINATGTYCWVRRGFYKENDTFE